MSVLTTDIDRLREAVAGYVHDADLEVYLHYSGQKDTLDTASIAARYGGEMTIDALRATLAAAAATGDAAESRRLRALAQAVGDLCIERELAPLSDELATLQAVATLDVDGETLGYYASAVVLQNEPDRARRRRLHDARNAVVITHNPLREQIFRRHHELIAGLGYPGYVEFYSDLKGIDVSALGATMQQFLARTRDVWFGAVAPWFEAEIGVPFAEAERHDAAVLFRMRDRDPWFSVDAMVDSLRDTLLSLGVALDDQPNVHLDLEDRPGKNPRAFCAAVRVPGEVYLVIRPSGGYQDYRSLFHEAGHTEHFAHVDAGRPFEDRHLGDNSVTEAFAFTMEHLLLDPDWIAAHTGAAGPQLHDFTRRAVIYYLYFLRRYGAKLPYELELHRAGPDRLAEMPERYAELLTDALGFRYDGAAYLDDVDPGF
ncbi:MAG TPA: hypothetical protein VI316_11760, partial [Candidatus Dormibacteraeota bacterium]